MTLCNGSMNEWVNHWFIFFWYFHKNLIRQEWYQITHAQTLGSYFPNLEFKKSLTFVMCTLDQKEWLCPTASCHTNHQYYSWEPYREFAILISLPITKTMVFDPACRICDTSFLIPTSDVTAIDCSDVY